MSLSANFATVGKQDQSHDSSLDWLKDKERFALAAVYRPYSRVEKIDWMASPRTTNGNEQSHRDIYRDGINLTVLSGIKTGEEYDRRAAVTYSLPTSQQIERRDRVQSHSFRTERTYTRRSK